VLTGAEGAACARAVFSHFIIFRACAQVPSFLSDDPLVRLVPLAADYGPLSKLAAAIAVEDDPETCIITCVAQWRGLLGVPPLPLCAHAPRRRCRCRPPPFFRLAFSDPHTASTTTTSRRRT
jgi:hypothetical protein